MKRLKEFIPEKLRFFDVLWLGAPVAIWFAYQPLIRLGQDGTMYYELSVTMLYSALLALVSLPSIWRYRHELVKLRAAWVVEVFVIISLLSLVWTMNLTRGILTVGVTGILYVIFLGAMAERVRVKRLLPKIVRIYLYSALVMCGLAVAQFFAGLWLDAQTTLLCAGCVAEQFGFVRPNVFLIEPQFLGSALLPAVLLLTYRAVTGRKDWRVFVGLFVVVTVLVLTLSRGALAAGAVGVVLLVALYAKNVQRWMAVVGIFTASLVGALVLQGTAAVMNPAIDETFGGAVTKSIHQLTMGIVDIRSTRAEPEQTDPVVPQETNQPHFDGYVEESTDARTTRTSLALQRWNVDAPTMLFGVGIGSAGLAMHEMFPNKIGAREIVQNEYVETLLERGLVGLVSFLAVLGALFVATKQQKWLWSIIAAFMVQWLFFSGYPNALHVYLALILIATYSRSGSGSASATSLRRRG